MEPVSGQPIEFRSISGYRDMLQISNACIFRNGKMLYLFVLKVLFNTANMTVHTYISYSNFQSMYPGTVEKYLFWCIVLSSCYKICTVSLAN